MISIEQAHRERIARRERHIKDLIVVAGATTDCRLSALLARDIHVLRAGARSA